MTDPNAESQPARERAQDEHEHLSNLEAFEETLLGAFVEPFADPHLPEVPRGFEELEVSAAEVHRASVRLREARAKQASRHPTP